LNMAAQWVLTRITKDKKAFIIGNPSEFLQLVQSGKAQAKKAYPGQQIVLRNLEAFNQTPVPKKYQ
jgi:hypothetical protein